MHSDERFEYLLNKILRGEISEEDDEFEDFNESYIWLDCVGAEGVSKIKLAAERGYKLAYYHLAQAYFNGIGCNKNLEQGIEWLRKSIAAKEKGACLLGDCYRLGIGVEKNYDTAWIWYEKAVEIWDERGEHPEPKELLLQVRDDEYLDFMETAGVDVSWWEYAISKNSSQRVIAKMPDLYPWKSESFWFWIQKAADYGTIWAKYLLAQKLLEDKNNPNNLALAIELLTAVSFSRNENRVDAAKLLLGMNVDFEFKQKLACKLYQNGGEDWQMLLALYKDDEEELASLLMDCDDCDDDYDIPTDMFECSCCHHIFSIDDQNDPDAQGDCCDDCYYSGRILEKDDEKEED